MFRCLIFWVSAVSAICDVCHLRNSHTKDLSTEESKTQMPECKGWSENSCCSPFTAGNIHNDTLYGEDYTWDRCGELSPACQAYFIAEACFYECDVNAGKYRLHDDCAENAWQMHNMPIKASYCDGWWGACKDDLFCGAGSFFDCPASPAILCKPMKEIYANGQAICEVMWDGAFKYETDEDAAYTMSLPDGFTLFLRTQRASSAHSHLDECMCARVLSMQVGTALIPDTAVNPNNLVEPDRPFPAQCPDHNPDKSPCGVEEDETANSRASVVGPCQLAVAVVLVVLMRF